MWQIVIDCYKKGQIVIDKDKYWQIVTKVCPTIFQILFHYYLFLMVMLVLYDKYTMIMISL